MVLAGRPSLCSKVSEFSPLDIVLFKKEVKKVKKIPKPKIQKNNSKKKGFF
jgi:hypothetical protein